MENEGIEELFIGREHEKDFFRQWRENTDPDAPWILYLYDALPDPAQKGGVGKTWLLHEYAKIARQLDPTTVVVTIDFFNAAERDGAVIADHVVDALKDAYPGWYPENYSRLLVEYRNMLREAKEDISVLRSRFSDALIADLADLNERLLCETNACLLVLFDTYELIEQDPVTATLRLNQAFPDNYNFQRMRVVFAGRNPLDWKHPNWRGREHEIVSLPIAPFTPEEILEYFKKISSGNIELNIENARHIYERTEGRPILVGLVSDVLGHQILSLKDLVAIPKPLFETSLVAHINDLKTPIDTIVLFMSHAYHRFNFSLLSTIIQETDYADLLKNVDEEQLTRELINLSFVRRSRSGNEFMLHDEMKPLVDRYCWESLDTDQRFRKTLSRGAIRFYEARLLEERSEQLRQAYTVALLYHKAYVDLNEGYRYFDEKFSKALDVRSNSFARSLLHEMRLFGGIITREQRSDLRYKEAELYQREENAQRALQIFEELEQEVDPSWLQGHQGDILRMKGMAYQQLSRFAEAMLSFSAALEIEEARGDVVESAFLLSWLGSVYQRQGQLDEAVRYYEDALKLLQQHGNDRARANILMNIGNVYRLQGKIDEALRRCKLSLRLRQDLFKQGRISEIYVGWSLSTIGAIYYHTDEWVSAEQFFIKAYDIFVRTGHKKGLATINNRFGQIALARMNLQDAMNWFEKAYYASLGIDTETQINSLNKQGWVFVLQKQWKQASDKLDQAIELARQVHDDYQLAESLLDLADMFERQDLHEQAEQVLVVGDEICLQYNYYRLLALSRGSLGDIQYERDNYEQAFHYYAQSCQYMAQHNALRYKQTLRRMIDVLLEVPYTRITSIIEWLIAYWVEQGLAEENPDFIASCEEVKMLIGR